MLEIVTLLENSQKRWKAEDFANYFSVSERTFFRDKEIMINVGIPIEYDPHRQSYIIKDDFSFSPPELTKKEAAALILTARSFSNETFPYYKELEVATSKIIHSLPESISKIIEQLENKIEFGSVLSVDLGNHINKIKRLEDCIKKQRRVEMEYYSISSNETRLREVDPYTIFFKEGAGYLVGLCHLRDEKRMFRLDRIKKVEIIPVKFKRPDDYSVENYFDGAWGVERGRKINVVVDFKGFAARFVQEGNWHDSQEIENLREEHIRFSVKTGSYREIKKWILSFGREAEVIKPSKLREELKEEIEAMGNNYSK